VKWEEVSLKIWVAAGGSELWAFDVASGGRSAKVRWNTAPERVTAP